MSLNTTTTISPVTPDKQLRAAYLVSSSPRSLSGSRARSRSPGNGLISTLDPRQTTPMTDGRRSPGNESANGDGEWSSAVGRASVAGKSGRVIERLMGDVDKLKRELNLAQARVEEEQLRGASAREALDSLRGTKENLEAINETNQNIIARRERKIEELKAELEAERKRRLEAETKRDDLHVKFGDLKVETEKEVDRATEIAARSQAEYDACRTALKRMKADLDKQVREMRKELAVVQTDRDKEKRHIKQLVSTGTELQARQMSSDKATERVFAEFQEYKKLRDDSIREMAERIASGDAANEQLHDDLAKTLGEMRWVLNVRRDAPTIRQKEDIGPDPRGKAG